MLSVFASLAVMLAGGSEAGSAFPTGIPLVEALNNFSATPSGYVAYEVRIWGSASIGKAEQIVFEPGRDPAMTVITGFAGLLERRDTADPLATSIIFLPKGFVIDPRVLALSARPKDYKIEPSPIVLIEVIAERTPEFRTYTFRYPRFVFNGPVKSILLGRAGVPRFDENGHWLGTITLIGSDNFTGRLTESGELSRIRLPTNVAVPKELLP